MNTMNPQSPLEPLALAVYAMELAGLDVQPTPEALQAAEEGQAFSLDFEFVGSSQVELRFVPETGYFEVAVHLSGGYARETLVWAAMGLNHEMQSRTRRFSIEPYTGDLVLSDVLHWDQTSPDDLALCVCDLIILMGQVEDLNEPSPQAEPMAALTEEFPSGALRG
jgi:hypothetical protein